MAQVIDTTGKQRDASRKANGLPQVVSGSSHGGNKTEVKPDLKPEVQQQQQQQSQRQYSSSPFSRAVRRYTGMSGGTPTTSRTRQPSQQWSPTYASLSNSDASGLSGPYWDSLRERGDKGGMGVEPEDTTEQKSEEPSELAPNVVSALTSDSGYDYKPGNWSASDEPGVYTASMSSAHPASDNRLKKPVSSIKTNLHGEQFDETPWSERDEELRNNDAYERDMLAQGMSRKYLNDVVRNSYTLEDAWNDTLDGIGSDKSPIERASTHLVDKPKWYDDSTDSLVTSVDDGTMDRQHLLSDWMTGNQYYHYVHDLGMPGLPENQIVRNDDSRYSKSEQNLLYDFPVYTPNEEYRIGMSLPTAAAATRAASDYVSNFRTRGNNNVDYDISTDTGYGPGTFSGRDYERTSPAYFAMLDETYKGAESGNAKALSSMIYDPGDVPHTTMVKQWELPDGSLHYGVITDERVDFDIGDEGMQGLVDNGSEVVDSDGYSVLNDEGNPTFMTADGFILNTIPNEGGYILDTNDENYQKWLDSHSVYRIDFSDGSSSEMPASDAMTALRNVDWVNYNDTGLDIDPTGLTVGTPSTINDSYEEDGAEVGAYFVPDMILSDGTRISYDVAQKIFDDKNPDDADKDGISYDFQPSGLNPLKYGAPGAIVGAATGMGLPLMATDSRPRRFLKPPVDENGLHIFDTDFLNNVADWSANSATISVPYLQWVNSVAQAMPYFSGVDGQSRDENGMYQSTGYDDGNYKKISSMVPVLAGPALENLAGNVGHETWLDKVIEPLIDSKFPKGTPQNVLAHALFDMFGEGIEENFGDIVDELGTYGLDAYANPARYLPYDEDVYVVDDDGKSHKIKSAGEDFYGPLPLGLKTYDEHNRELRDPDTPISDRVMNFLPHTPDQIREAANSFIGGAGVSGLMGIPDLIKSGFESHAQKKRGDFGSASYATHMDALGRDLPYAGKSFDYAKRDARRRYMGNAEQPELDVKLPDSISPVVRDKSDIIGYDPEDYLVPDDFELPEIK